MRMTSNNNEWRHPNRLRIVMSAVTALLSATPSAHALVAPPSASPQHRPLRRVTLPSPMKLAPRADRTALRYLDERTDAAPAFRNVRTLREQARTIEQHDVTPVFRNLWTLREQARTIKQHDRQLYFDFVNSAESTAPGSAFPPRPLQRLARERGSAPTSAPSATPGETTSEVPSAAPSAGLSPSSLLFSLPLSVASLWTQARTVAEDDRRRYFDFVENQSLVDHLVTEPGLASGLAAKRKNSVNIDKWW